VAWIVQTADTVSDRERVAAVLPLAFASDTVVRWLHVAANRWWAHVDSNHGPLPTANGRRPESVKLLGWTEATAREVFLPRHEEAFDLRAEEAVAESPLHRPQVTL
jgi:hypothetical protein